MKFKFNNGLDEYEISTAIPLAVVGGVGQGKTFYVKRLISTLAKERKVLIMNPCRWGEYNSFADKVVPVKLWLSDSKYRFPSESSVTLLDFNRQEESSERICEVLERVKNISEKEDVVLIVDTIGAANGTLYRELVQKVLQAQSEKLFVVLTAQSANALDLQRNDVQVILTSSEEKCG